MKLKQLLFILFLITFQGAFASVPDSIVSTIPDSVDYNNKEQLFFYSEKLIGNQELEKGYILLKDLKKHFLQEKNIRFLAKTEYNIGDYFYFKNEYDSALIVYESVLQKTQIIKDTFLTAKTLNSLGLIHAYNSETNLALNCYLEEINLIDQIKNPSKDFKNEKLVVLINIIGLYVARDEAQSIISYANNAIHLAEELNDSIRLGSAYNLLGVGYRYNKDYEHAKIAFDKSIKIFEDVNDNYYLSFLYVNVGTLYEYLKEYEVAIDYNRKGLDGFMRDDYFYGIHTALNNLGNIYLKIGDYSQAKTYLLQVISTPTSFDFPAKLKDTYNYLSKVESKLGNYKKAYEYQEKFIELTDSISQKEKEEQYAELQTKFESIQKDYEINILKTEKIEHELRIQKNQQQLSVIISIAFGLLILIFFSFRNLRIKNIANQRLLEKNQQIEKQNEQLSIYNQQLTLLNEKLKISESNLADSNKTKDRFISILAHDLRNPLHNIIGQSFLLSESYSQLSEADRINYSKNINVSTDQMSRLLDNLLEWARAQSKGIKFAPILFDLRNVVQNVEAVLNNLAKEKSIKLVNNIPFGISIYADKSMIETVIRNLANNSIKFTKEGGKITISASLLGSYIVTKISDTGVGISEENCQLLFKLDHNLKTRGTNNERGTGLGLIICKEFIDLHKGKIWVESEINKGSDFYFSIPILES